MAISTVKHAFLFVITMATLDFTSCQLAAISTSLPDIITLLENVTDLDWQQNLQKTQNQIANSQNQTSSTLTQMASSQVRMEDSLTQTANSQSQTASTLTQMANTQAQMANTMNQVASLLQMQSNQLNNMTAAMTTMVSLLENQQETLDNMSQSLPLVLKQQENQIEFLKRLPVYRDCSDYDSQNFWVSRPYTITPEDGMGSLRVYCRIGGGGWTVFQRRYDGSVDFNRSWDDYEHGFGSPDGEHWMALREIHRLTRNGRWSLFIEMEAFDGDVAYAEYDSFSIGDAGSNYTLSVGAYIGGRAGDALTYHNNQAFTTKDMDNDNCDLSCSQHDGNCARKYQGAWWYRDCRQSNLNGLYLGPSGDSDTGNVWYPWKGNESLKKSMMMMRRED